MYIIVYFIFVRRIHISSGVKTHSGYNTYIWYLLILSILHWSIYILAQISILYPKLVQFHPSRQQCSLCLCIHISIQAPFKSSIPIVARVIRFCIIIFRTLAHLPGQSPFVVLGVGCIILQRFKQILIWWCTRARGTILGVRTTQALSTFWDERTIRGGFTVNTCGPSWPATYFWPSLVI